MLRERHRFPEFRAIGEMKDEPAFDIRVAGHLQQIPACEELAGLRAQLQKAMHRPFGPTHWHQILPRWTGKYGDGQNEHPSASHLTEIVEAKTAGELARWLNPSERFGARGPTSVGGGGARRRARTPAPGNASGARRGRQRRVGRGGGTRALRK